MQISDTANYFFSSSATSIVLAGIAILFFVLFLRERKRSKSLIHRHRERQAILYNVNLAITSTLELRLVLDILLNKVTPLLPDSTAAGIWLANKETGRLEPVASRNLDEQAWKVKKGHFNRGLAHMVYDSDAPLMSRNAQTDPRTRDPEFFRAQGLVSYLGVPLTAKGDNLGVLSFFTKKEYEFTNEEIEFFFTLAGQAAIAIYNSQLYEQSKKQAAELIEANRVKDEFLSIMSHELRTPISTVMGYTRMVQAGMLGEINQEQTQALGKVTKNSNDLLTMINSIMEATKIEAGVSKVETYEVPLVDFLDDLKSFYFFPLGKELSLEWDYPHDLPVLHTDGAKLKHVLQNLIINAIKFTEKGLVSVCVRHRPDKKEIEFKVSDTGIGISYEALPVIFERFRQLDSSERRVHGGVGLGLHIVKKFTEMLGGTVQVESKPGKGSTFTVQLPVAPS